MSSTGKISAAARVMAAVKWADFATAALQAGYSPRTVEADANRLTEQYAAVLDAAYAAVNEEIAEDLAKQMDDADGTREVH